MYVNIRRFRTLIEYWGDAGSSVSNSPAPAPPGLLGFM